MTTKVYGASDDLVEFDGDLSGEVGCYGTDGMKLGLLVAFSDGTILAFKYDAEGDAIWRITTLREGDMLDRVERCKSEGDNDDEYSDVAHFRDGNLRAWSGGEGEVVN